MPRKTKKVEAKVNTPMAAEVPAVKKEPILFKHVRPEKVEGFKATPINLIKEVMTKEGFQILLERYKEQNPEKYEAKKSALEAKLKGL